MAGTGTIGDTIRSNYVAGSSFAALFSALQKDADEVIAAFNARENERRKTRDVDYSKLYDPITSQDFIDFVAAQAGSKNITLTGLLPKSPLDKADNLDDGKLDLCSALHKYVPTDPTDPTTAMKQSAYDALMKGPLPEGFMGADGKLHFEKLGADPRFNSLVVQLMTGEEIKVDDPNYATKMEMSLCLIFHVENPVALDAYRELSKIAGSIPRDFFTKGVIDGTKLYGPDGKALIQQADIIARLTYELRTGEKADPKANPIDLLKGLSPSKTLEIPPLILPGTSATQPALATFELYGAPRDYSKQVGSPQVQLRDYFQFKVFTNSDGSLRVERWGPGEGFSREPVLKETLPADFCAGLNLQQIQQKLFDKYVPKGVGSDGSPNAQRFGMRILNSDGIEVDSLETGGQTVSRIKCGAEEAYYAKISENERNQKEALEREKRAEKRAIRQERMQMFQQLLEFLRQLGIAARI